MAEDRDERLYKEAERRTALRTTIYGFMVANVVCWAIYLLTSPGGYPWPLWVLFGGGLALLSGWARNGSGALSVDKEYDKLKSKRD